MSPAGNYFENIQYDRRESSKIPMHAGCGKRRGKDYNSRGNPAKFMRDPHNVSRSSPASANFTRDFSCVMHGNIFHGRSIFRYSTGRCV